MFVLLTVVMVKLLLNLEAFPVQYNKTYAPKIFSHSQNLCLDICDSFPWPPFTFYIKLQGPWSHGLFLWGEYYYRFSARLVVVLLQGIAVCFGVPLKILRFFIFIASSLACSLAPSHASSLFWSNPLFITLVFMWCFPPCAFGILECLLFQALTQCGLFFI